jgi:hypothetical protein
LLPSLLPPQDWQVWLGMVVELVVCLEWVLQGQVVAFHLVLD